MKSSCSVESRSKSLVPWLGSTESVPPFPISFLVNSINLPEMLDDLITHRFFVITLFNTKTFDIDRDRNRARSEREHKLNVEQQFGKPENTN